MKVEIWSDVMCPFCYIGKRRFEDALQQFGHKDSVEIEWKSFQLDPDLKTNPSVNISKHLADRKGWALEYAQQMSAQVTEMAAEVGLTYNFDKAIVANSFKAHRFSHFAKRQGYGNAAEEALFKAYFTLGENIDDNDTLANIGAETGLDRNEVTRVLNSNDYADEVKHDIAEAQYLGIRGVPFFVMNGKYAVSGAQAVPVFSETLEKAFGEWQEGRTSIDLDTQQGMVCRPNGDC